MRNPTSRGSQSWQAHSIIIHSSFIQILYCNGQVKQDTLLSRLFIKFPLILNRGLCAFITRFVTGSRQ